MLLKQVAILAVCCSCSPDVFMEMRESRLYLYCRVVREAHSHIKAEEGLQYARSFMDPKPVVEQLYGKPVESKGVVDKIKDWAERIRRMPDSGSHSSKRRMERRKGQQ